MFIKKRENIIVIIIIIVTLLVSIFIFFNILNILKYKEGDPKDILYQSNIKSSNNYTVYLKDNEFIENKLLVGKNSYITDLVEYINTNFIYENQGINDIQIKYIYNIKANVICEYIAEENNDVTNSIFNKEFTLLKDIEKDSKDSNFKINTSINIGLNYYNTLVNKFRNSLNIPIRARLEIKFNIKVIGNRNTKTFTKENYILLTIPLDVKAFDIKEFKNFSNKEMIYSNNSKKSETSYMLAIINIIILSLVLGGSWYLIKLVKNKDKNKYYEEIRKILKTYDDRIVTVSNFVKYEKLEIVDLPNFDELLQLSNETLEPIIYWRKRGIRKVEAWFSILRNKILYRYIILYNPNTNIKNNKEKA